MVWFGETNYGGKDFSPSNNDQKPNKTNNKAVSQKKKKKPFKNCACLDSAIFHSAAFLLHSAPTLSPRKPPQTPACWHLFLELASCVHRLHPSSRLVSLCGPILTRSGQHLTTSMKVKVLLLQVEPCSPGALPAHSQLFPLSPSVLWNQMAPFHSSGELQ